jgi:hypothetical protein
VTLTDLALSASLSKRCTILVSERIFPGSIRRVSAMALHMEDGRLMTLRIMGSDVSRMTGDIARQPLRINDDYDVALSAG